MLCALYLQLTIIEISYKRYMCDTYKVEILFPSKLTQLDVKMTSIPSKQNDCSLMTRHQQTWS